MHSYSPNYTLVYNYLLCLNPCFNGRCTRTTVKKQKIEFTVVGLNPCFNGRCTRTQDISDFNHVNNGSIFVLLEDPLVLYELEVYGLAVLWFLLLFFMEDALLLK